MEITKARLMDVFTKTVMPSFLCHPKGFGLKKKCPHVFNFGSTQVNTLQLVKVCKMAHGLKNKTKQEVDSFRVLYGAQQVYHGGHGEKQQSIPGLWRKYSGKPHTLTGTHRLTNRTLIKRKTAQHISNPSTLTDKKQLIPRTELQHSD